MDHQQFNSRFIAKYGVILIAIGVLLVIASAITSFRTNEIVNRPEDWTNTVAQPNPYACGYACMKMILTSNSIEADSSSIAIPLNLKPGKGTTMAHMRRCGELLGLKSKGWNMSYEELVTINLPAIVHVGDVHFVVLDSINNDRAIVRDPLNGVRVMKRNDFEDVWTGNVLEFSRAY